MTTPIPAAARRAANALFREWNTCDVEAVIARECHLAETVAMLRRICRQDGVPLADGNWMVRLTPAEVRSARDLLATLEGGDA